MEVLIFLIGFAAAVLVVPASVSRRVQGIIRRKVGDLISNKKKEVR